MTTHTVTVSESQADALQKSLVAIFRASPSRCLHWIDRIAAEAGLLPDRFVIEMEILEKWCIDKLNGD